MVLSNSGKISVGNILSGENVSIQLAFEVMKHILIIYTFVIILFLFYQVKIEALNDSKHIGTCIYNVVILAVVCVILSMAITENVQLEYSIISLFLIFGVTLTECIIFAPKVSCMIICMTYAITSAISTHPVVSPTHSLQLWLEIYIVYLISCDSHVFLGRVYA